MDLIDYFIKNEKKLDRKKWYKNQEIISEINELSEEEKKKFIIGSKEVALDLFKNILEPNTNKTPIYTNTLYILLCYYFEKKKLIIIGIEDLLENPINILNIKHSLGILISYIRDKKVKDWDYKKRREFNQKLYFKEETLPLQNEKLFSYIEIKKLSTSDKKFNLLEKREQLETLVKTIENLLKKDNGNFIEIPDQLLNPLNNEIIKNYRTSNWIIRHGSEKALEQMKNITKDQLYYLVDLGIVICGRIYFLKENKKI